MKADNWKITTKYHEKNLSDSSFLITGGAGFIGSRLCEKLVEKNYNVTILDNLSPQIHAKGESLLYRKVKDISSFIKGDVRNREDWKKAIKGQDIIVHLAAETGTGQSMYEVEKYNDVNIMGTAHLLELLANSKHSVKKMIIASSRAVYGEGKYNCQKHGSQYPTSRKQKDMEIGEFNPKCEICNNELFTLATDEKSKIHPCAITTRPQLRICVQNYLPQNTANEERVGQAAGTVSPLKQQPVR